MDRIVRINVNTHAITHEKCPDDYTRSGGRNLIAKILINEVKPTCEALGKNNKLVFAMGLLTGTTVSCANRLSIGAKSPLTGGIKESNSGGIFAMRLAQSGIKLLIIEDIPCDDNWYNIVIENEACRFEPADQYRSMGTYQYCEEISLKYPDCAAVCIGPAGEHLNLAAGIAVMDMEKHPNRFCARGGLGAVMGSKKIKGIIVVGKSAVKIADRDRFKLAFTEYTAAVKAAPNTATYGMLGTASLVKKVNNLGGLPVNNFSIGSCVDMEKISGETMFETIKARGGEGKTTHSCMPGCIIQCSNIYPDKEGKTIVASLEYENIGLLGSNLGICDLDQIARLNYSCNDIGLDTIETGATIGVAMEAGLAVFGDYQAAQGMLEEIRQGSVLGRLLGSGTSITGKVLGVSNIPAVNGQSVAAYDPRAIKGMGVTYATSTMGADHTFGPMINVKVDPANKEGQAALFTKTQINVAVVDSLGLCLFSLGAYAANFQLLVNLINAKYGWEIDVDWIMRMGDETLANEHQFNQLAGFSNARYRLPECFTERVLPNLNTSFDVSDNELDQVVMRFRQ